jgi:signal recognition particle receptor subunit beta
MEWGSLLVVGIVTLCAAGAAIILSLSRQRSQLQAQLREVQAAYASVQDTRSQVALLSGQHIEITTRLEEVQRDNLRKAEWLDNLEKENEWFREELEKRPRVTRRTYKILTLGVSGTGKTALTLKWANPLTDLGTLAGTKIDRYQRTVSLVTGKEAMTEHVFEIGDWGGEYIVDAHQELVMDEIHGLLLVVDLAGRDATTVEPRRIEQQLRDFQAEVLKFFFGPRTVASCKTVVLFINKSDLLSGTPAEVERMARSHYKRLIDDLEKHDAQLNVQVLVGSATSGHSVHHLFSHFVERILPSTAYDAQLLQRMKDGAAPAETR